MDFASAGPSGGMRGAALCLLIMGSAGRLEPGSQCCRGSSALIFNWFCVFINLGFKRHFFV